MRQTKVLFVHSSLQYFSGKTNKFIRYWNEFHKGEFKISVLALDPKNSINDYLKNSLEIEIEKYHTPIYSIKDIKNFKLKETLVSIAPDIVAMYDDGFVVNAALINTCRKLNIPTIYIQHGMYSKSPVRKNISIKEYPEKINNYVLFISFYVKSVGFKMNRYFNFIKKLYKMSIYNESVNPTIVMDDFHCDFAAVWNQSNKKLAIESKGYQSENTFIVGNPDGNNMFSKNFTYNYLSENVLYVAQPLTEFNVISKEEFIKWSNSLINNLPENIKLFIRPHPKSDTIFLKYCFPNSIITLNEELELCYVIGHFSTYNIKTSSLVPTILVYFNNTLKYTNNEIFDEIQKISNIDIELLINTLNSRKNLTHLLKSNLSEEYLSDFYKETTKAIQEILVQYNNLIHTQKKNHD